MSDFMERVPFRYMIHFLKTTRIERLFKDYKRGANWQPTIFADLQTSLKREKRFVWLHSKVNVFTLRNAYYVKIVAVCEVEQMDSVSEITGRPYSYQTRVCSVQDVKGHVVKLRLNGQFINRLEPKDAGKVRKVFLDERSVSMWISTRLMSKTSTTLTTSSSLALRVCLKSTSFGRRLTDRHPNHSMRSSCILFVLRLSELFYLKE